MEETYRLLIEFKTIHPLRFWIDIFIVTSLVIFAIWRLSRKKQKSKIEPLENQRATSTVVAVKESVKPKIETNKEKSTLEKPETKDYTDTSAKGNLEVNEPKPIYIKPTETKQEKTIPKVETLEVKPKAKSKSEEQLPKSKEETAKSKDEVLFVNYDILGRHPLEECLWLMRGKACKSSLTDQILSVRLAAIKGVVWVHFI